MTEKLAASQTSSIGAVWPPEKDTKHNRLRGFYTEGVVRTPGDIAWFAGQFAQQRENAAQTEKITRLSIRVVAHAGALAALHEMGVPVEAALPLAGTQSDLVIAYAGVNCESRSMSAERTAQWRARLQEAITRPRDTQDRTAELHAQGFTPHLVTPQNAEGLVPRFTELYTAFGYDENDVAELLTGSANTIAYVEDGERVVSTALAESGTVEVDGLPPLNLVEITEASTHPDYRGRGLYKAISGYLTDRLLREHGGDINALYGESNLAQRGVLFAAHENGRRFSCFDDYGIASPAFGILPQNFHVADGAETRPYNDFALSYAPLR